MSDDDKPYSDPEDQRSLADALSQTSTYSPANLVSALRKKDAPARPQYQAGQGMPPWAADQPPQDRAPMDFPMKPQEPGMFGRAANWVKQQLSPAPAMAAGVTPQGDQQRAAVADAQANADRLKSVQMAPDTGAPSPGAASAQPPQNMAPPAPPQTIGERWVNTMEPADRDAMAAAQGEQLAGVDAKAKAEAEAADEMARLAYHGHEDARVQQLLDKAALDPQQRALDQHALQLQAAAERNSRQKVDPSHYLANAPAGARILMAIGLAFSGFKSGLRGGPNDSMEMIKSAIDDDNRAQLQNIENGRASIEQQKGVLADKIRLFGNKEQGLAAARQEQLQGVAAQIDDVARQYQSPAILAEAQRLKGQLQEHFDAEGAAVKRYVPAQTVGGGPSDKAVHELAAKWISEGRYGNPDEAVAAARQTLGSQVGPANVQATQKPGPAGSTMDLSEIESAGQTAVRTGGLSAFIGRYAPAWLAPGSARDAQNLGFFNRVVISGVMKNLESRMSPEQVAETKATLSMKESDPPALRRQKLAQLEQMARVSGGVKGKAVTGGDQGPAEPGNETYPGEGAP